jgi:carbon storage regulator
MLVLSRKAGQQVMIGEDIHITIVRMEGGRVTIGIEAPRDQRIIRGELADLPIVIDVPSSEDLPTVNHTPERTLL